MSAKRAKANSELKERESPPHPQDFFPYWNLKLHISLFKRKTNWFKSLCSCRKTLSFESTSYAIENFRPVVRIEGRLALTGAKFYPTVLFFCLKAFSRITFFILFRASNHKRCRQRESKLICIWSLHIWIQISHTIPTGLSFVRQSVLNK